MIWKDIPGYEGSYQCSNTGMVRSLDRYVYEHTGKKQFRKGQILITTKHKNGYEQIALNKNGIRKLFYVHFIVALTFIPNTKNFKIVNHMDGNKLNNNVDNLEWTTYSGNLLHAYKVLHRTISNKGAKAVSIKIIDVLNKNEYIYPSIAKASENIKLSETQIRRYLNSNKLWKRRYLFITNNNKCVEDNEKVFIV